MHREVPRRAKMAGTTDTNQIDTNSEADASNNRDLELAPAAHQLPLTTAQQHLERRSSILSFKRFSELSKAPDKPDVTGHASQPLSVKVAIPRVSIPAVGPANRRVSRACDSCREQKAKCSGHRPRCQRCHATDAICAYTDGKRARETKYNGPVFRNGSIITDVLYRQSAELMSRTRVYEDFLRGLQPLVDRQLAMQIENVLGGVRNP